MSTESRDDRVVFGPCVQPTLQPRSRFWSVATRAWAQTVTYMARNCTTNVKGSRVFYKDPATGRITELTRGRVLPVGVTRLVAQPYKDGHALQPFQQLRVEYVPGTWHGVFNGNELCARRHIFSDDNRLVRRLARGNVATSARPGSVRAS